MLKFLDFRMELNMPYIRLGCQKKGVTISALAHLIRAFLQNYQTRSDTKNPR
jgi:hypothetical protein